MDVLGGLVDPMLARIALVSRALTASLGPQEIVDIVARQQLAELGADGALIGLLDGADVLQVVAVLGSAVAAVERFGPLDVDREVPLAAAVRREMAVYVGSRREAATEFPELLAAAPDSHAWAAMPLVAGGTVLGALGVSFRAERTFSEPERLFLRTLADLAALALAPTSARVDRHEPGSAVPRHEVAILDAAGVIQSVNEAWTAFCAANGGDERACGVGASYLDVCDAASDDSSARAVALAIRRVLAGDRFQVAPIRIPCHAPTVPRWFDVLVSARHDAGTVVGATVVLVPVAEVESDDRARPPASRTVLDVIGEHESEAESDVLRVLAASLHDLLGIGAVGMSLRASDGAPRRVYASDERIVPLVQLQQDAAAGPGIDACRSGRPVVVTDLVGHRDEWPTYVDAAVALGYGSVLTLPLGATVPSLGVLALYAPAGRAWSAADLGVAQAYAHVGSVFVTAVHELEQATSDSARLRGALARNGVIEQAKGLLAGTYGIALDDAFDVLRRYARANRLLMRDVAERVVSEGFRPPHPGASVRESAASGDSASPAATLDVINDVFRVGLLMAPLSVRDDDLGAFAEEVVASLDRCIIDLRAGASGHLRTDDELMAGVLATMERTAAQLTRAARRPRAVGDDVRTRTLVDAATRARLLVDRWRRLVADLRP